MQRLSWDDLELVLAIARSKTIRKTAATLGIDATTVGRRLAAIHARVGFALFERNAGGLAMTPAARTMVHELELMEAASMAVERTLVAAAEPVQGRVRIATSESFAMYWMLPDLAALRAELPGIELELVASHGIADLRRREADIAVRFVRSESDDLRSRRIGALRWSIYGSRSYLRGRAHRPDPQRGFESERVIKWGGGPLRQSIQTWMDAHASRAEVTLVAAHLHVIMEACAAGHGLAALPGCLALARGLEQAIDHSIDETELWLVVHKDLRKVPRVRAVADRLASRIVAAAERLRAI